MTKLAIVGSGRRKRLHRPSVLVELAPSTAYPRALGHHSPSDRSVRRSSQRNARVRRYEKRGCGKRVRERREARARRVEEIVFGSVRSQRFAWKRSARGAVVQPSKCQKEKRILFTFNWVSSVVGRTAYSCTSVSCVTCFLFPFRNLLPFPFRSRSEEGTETEPSGCTCPWMDGT